MLIKHPMTTKNFESSLHKKDRMYGDNDTRKLLYLSTYDQKIAAFSFWYWAGWFLEGSFPDTLQVIFLPFRGYIFHGCDCKSTVL